MENKKLALNFETDFLEEDELVFLPKEEQKQPETLEDIVVKQYKAGVALKQLTTSHGLSYGKVYEILNSKGAKLRHGRYSDSRAGKRLTTMSQLEKDSIIAYYKEGFEVREILEAFDLNKYGLYSILDEANVPRRQRKQFIALDIESIQNGGISPDQVPDDGLFKPTLVKSIAPVEPPIASWIDAATNILHFIVKKDAFKGDISQLTFTYDLTKCTVEIKEDK